MALRPSSLGRPQPVGRHSVVTRAGLRSRRCRQLRPGVRAECFALRSPIAERTAGHPSTDHPHVIDAGPPGALGCSAPMVRLSPRSASGAAGPTVAAAGDPTEHATDDAADAVTVGGAQSTARDRVRVVNLDNTNDATGGGTIPTGDGGAPKARRTRTAQGCRRRPLSDQRSSWAPRRHVVA
jgi:hypothetical protein